MGPPGPRGARGALVFAGGDAPVARQLPVPPADLVITADSGLEHARAMGVPVDVVVGDLDSVAPDVLDAAVADGAVVERHPVAKDATDLELALDAAADRGATDVRVVGVGGGRLDHFLGNVLLLSSPRYAHMRVDAHVGNAYLTVVHERVELTATAGALCSLLPLGGAAVGVRTDGLRFPLRHETLPPGTTRGVSNEFLATHATVTLDDGVLLAVIPQSTSLTDVADITDLRKDA
jgi:thiamine pyrophosphokinase